MNDFDLILQPHKKFKIKLQLCGGSQSLFPWLRKYALWDEWEEENWSALVDKTWEEAGHHSSTDGKMVIKDIEGDAISLSLSIDKESDIRRVISLVMHMDDPEYFESTFVTIWLNRLIQVQFGLYDYSTSDYRWFMLGSFLVTSSVYSYNAQAQQLQLSIADLMSAATSERGDQIGAEVKILAGTPMKEALEGTIERFFLFTLCQVTDFNGETVPYDLEFNKGAYPYEIVKKIISLYPTYEHFYTPDGVYIAQEIPTAVVDEVVLTADQMDKIIISDEGSAAPRDIKNVTEVWGQEIDAERTAESCDSTIKENVFYLFIDETFEVLEEGLTVAFTPDQNSTFKQQIQIQETEPCPLLVMDGNDQLRPIKGNELRADIQYVVRYTNGYFLLQGQSNIHAMCFLFNSMPDEREIDELRRKYGCLDIMIMLDRDSLFSVEWIGERVRVLSGGEYENIYTTELAEERAYYENWQTARVQDTLRLTTLYVPWVDVNQKIEYRSIATGKTNEYLINSIQVNLESFTMTMNVSRFYPFYPWLRKAVTWGEYSATGWNEIEGWYWDEVAYSRNENIG